MISELGKKILECMVLNDGIVSGAKISLLCNASLNTIRKELPALNDELNSHGCAIISHSSLGYELEKNDQHLANSYLDSILWEMKRFSFLNLQEYSRAYYLLRYLFSSIESITMDQLANAMYCSKSTLIREIPRMNTILKHYHLELKNTRGAGLQIEGSEFHKRICLLFLEKAHRALPKEERVQEEYFCNSLLLNRDPHIYGHVHNVFSKHLSQVGMIEIPFIYLPKIANYVIFAASRYYQSSRMEFTNEQIALASSDQVLPLVEAMYRDMPALVKDHHTRNDEYAVAMLMQTYRCLRSPDDIPKQTFDSLYAEAEDALNFIALSYDLQARFDEQLHVDLAMYLFNIQCSLTYEIPFDQEIESPASHSGILCSDLCAEFGKFYSLRHQVRLSEPALMGTYYLFNRCMAAHPYFPMPFNVLVTSIYGRYYSENSAAHLRRSYAYYIGNIDCGTLYSPDDLTRMAGQAHCPYDVIFSNAADTRAVKEPPMISLEDVHSQRTNKQFRSFINQYVLRKAFPYFPKSHFAACSCSSKEEAVNVIYQVLKDQVTNRADFLKDLAMKDYYINCERNHGIVAISPFNYTMEQPMIYLFVNRTPFIWNELPMRLLVFYSYGKGDSKSIEIITYFLKKLIQSSQNQLQNAIENGYEGLVTYLMNSSLL